MPHPIRRFAAALLLAAPLWALAAGDEAFQAAFQRFDAARQGKTEQIEPAIEAFRALPADPQRQPLVDAYLGSALALKGKAAWMPWNKLRYPEQGADQLDQALAALKPEHDKALVHGVPVSLQTRLVAAATFVALPDGIFHRRAQGAKLIAALKADPLLAAAPAAFKAEVDAADARLKDAQK